MKRRNGKIFWGGFFVALGSLILIAKLNIFESDWDFIWSWYPFTLVFIGIIIISKDSIVKPFTSAVFGIFLATLIYGSISNIVYEVEFEWDESDYVYEEFEEEFTDDIRYAELNLSGGAGYFKINRTTDQLVFGKAYGSLAEYRFNTRYDNSKVHVFLEQRKNNFTIFDDDFSNRLEVRLNPNPVWDFDLHFGAARARYDFSDFKVRSIDIETGVTDIDLKIGDLYPDTEVGIEMGAASLTILVPKESGCRLSGEMVLFSKDLEGFRKTSRGDNKAYETDNFRTAENKINIHIDGGVSKLEIRTY